LTDEASKVLEFARRYDLVLDETDAQMYVDHTAAIARNPNDPEHLAMALHFKSIFHWAKDEIKLGDFVGDPQCPHDCKWCRAHSERHARRTTEHFKGLKI
jgi:hypothetical protein